MQVHPSISPGFDDPVGNARSVFRAAMDAMARPGRPVAIRPKLAAPGPLSGMAASLLLMLCDFETPIWLDAPLADTPSVCGFLRFHTGARIVTSPQEAAFAVISDASRMPPLAEFAQGTAEYPDRSTTLIIGVRTIRDEGWKLQGPGISSQVQFSAAPLPDDFASQVRANRARFPRGVDIFLTPGDAITALPRSVTLIEAG